MTDAQILQLLGIMYFAFGLGAIIGPEFYKKLIEGYAENVSLMYISAFMVIIAGYLLITFHNIWVRDWPVVITVIGWMAFIKGFLMLVLPKMYIYICKAIKLKKEYLVAGGTAITLVGAFFMYLGYFVLGK